MYQGQTRRRLSPVRRHALGGNPLGGRHRQPARTVRTGTFNGTCSVLKTGPLKGKSAGRRRPDVSMRHRRDGDAVEQQRVSCWSASTKWQALTVYGGYAWIRQENPSDDYLNGLTTIGGWNVPATIPSTFPNAKKFWPTQWTNYTNYNVPRIAPFFWVAPNMRSRLSST